MRVKTAEVPQRTDCFLCYVIRGTIRESRNLQWICLSCVMSAGGGGPPNHLATTVFDAALHSGSECLVCGMTEWSKLLSLCAACHGSYAGHPARLRMAAAGAAAADDSDGDDEVAVAAPAKKKRKNTEAEAKPEEFHSR